MQHHVRTGLPCFVEARSIFGYAVRAAVGHVLQGDLNPRERHSRVTRDDGTVTVCTLRAATVLPRNCCAEFGRPLAKKVMSHSRDGPGVTAPLLRNIVPLTRVWNPPFRYPPLKRPRGHARMKSTGTKVPSNNVGIQSGLL